MKLADPTPCKRKQAPLDWCGACALLALLALGQPTVGGAQVPPIGPQFQVNTFTTSAQEAPSVAATSQGEFVVVWQSYGSTGTDASFMSIQGRRYDASGGALGAEFQINSYTTDNQKSPAVALGEAGDFVVVWINYGAESVLAQRFDGAGNALGGEFLVNDASLGGGSHPAVVSSSSGNFVVLWSSNSTSGDDTSGQSIQARLFDGDGVALTGQFQVNSYTTLNQWRPAVAASSQGDFVVVWESYGSAGSDASSYSVQGRLYDAAGAPLTGEFQINTYTTSRQGYPTVGASAEGEFVVAWTSDGSGGSDTSVGSVQARRFAATGTALGGQFQVNAFTTDNQTFPDIAADAVGNFSIVWRSLGPNGPDPDYSIQGQRYLSDEQALGSQFQVNTYGTNLQTGATIAASGQRDFVVAWTSSGSDGTDQSGDSVQAQRYGCLFCDYFDTGDMSRWSMTAP